ncbi:dermonecrotic toxin domain-containing protein [Pseudomonas haemolytica]|uniref:Dermonecrotic toxin N-terminal domain-containing protein n=1 Tax=Pseudomonas haemolytica TaxID=2600065 RepID=A0A5P1D6R5_9PSED|nr:DUF6543 domain-containing protein [Pseudomonas haemolytica]MBJ2244350.1 hypothetical protein [Pseudomonas haemolytica]MBJ2271796.1 hypothetical protein [Pseudomonas haemolytica]MBK3447954.1 hypothetical protein [Pseudomonas haemolytica]MRJ35800.1 hypothetical protein [Pseudomonas haemolytica]
MTDTPDVNLNDFGLSLLLPPANIEENLLLDATQRWQDCCKEMRELMAGTPSVRTVVNQMLLEHLQLDGERTALKFLPTQARGSSILSINEACLYMQQHPSLDTTQVPEGQLILPSNHRLSGYTVPMVLDELKGLDLEQAIKDAWTRHFLNNRAPDQPVSCRARATELYKIHFEASGEALLAQGAISAAALNPLFAIIDPLLAEPGAEKICTEQIVLMRPAADALVLPGAWVLTLDTDQPVSQLVYLPAHQPAWRTFAKRTDMERWLITHQQVLFSTANFEPLATIGYRLKTRPLQTGISDWLNLLADAQFREAIKPVPGVEIDNANMARLPVEAFDKQRQSHSLFAQAPELPARPPLEDAPFAQFGLLYASLPLSHRQARVQQQRSALDTLFGETTAAADRNAQVQRFKQQLDELRVHQQASAVAARLMLERRPSDVATLNTQFTALYNARVAGLRIEAQIQQALNQISADELKLLEVVLDSPVAKDRLVEVAAYSMTLSVTEQTNATKKITESELNGPLVFTAVTALKPPPTSAASYLVYWPGAGGALQRFTSRHALEAALFNIAPQDDQLALMLKELTGNPFEHSLSLQQTEFEEHAAQLRSTYASPDDADTLAEHLKTLREETFEQLLVPEHSAREAAFLQIVEQNNSSHLAEKLPTWLGTQTEDQRELLKSRLKAYIPALKRAQALLDRSLAPRDEFVRLKIDSRLREDFSITQGFTVQLELPDSTTEARDPVEGGSGVGGTPFKMKTTPSLQRSKMSLDELALSNIDSSLGKRLHYMTLEVTADNTAELNSLKAGINGTYLVRMIRDLNLAKNYETRIYQAFRGTPQASTFQQDYRRECLTEPLRLMLKIQGQLAFMQNHITADDLNILEIAIDADTQADWAIGTQRIALLPATLVDDSDNNAYGTVTLSGVSFIQEKTSGTTLLYLPDAPDERCLRRFDSLELARKKLFDLCSLDSMVNYVASRALTGEPRSHVNRIDLAKTKNFDAIIGVGFPWPVTTSLAAHQLDAHMGRLIESNRNDARSNEDLADEKYALKSGFVFNGIKIALGFIPLIGTAVSLADATTSLYAAVDAFRKGDTHHGIDQLASVFECLVYAGMDALTFAAVPPARPATAKALILQHQLKHAWRPGFWRNLKSRQAKTSGHRFAGYEFDQPLEIGSLQPVHTGAYRHTLRHTSGEHFIADGGRYFKVKFDPTTHEMRLTAKGKHYSPVIALDQALEWNTYSALYGGRLTAYGGGSRRGRGASRAGASGPPAVNRQLPDAALQINMQRLELNNSVIKQFNELCSQVTQSDTKLKKYLNDHPTPNAVSAQKTRDSKALDIDLTKDIEDAKKMHTSFEDARQKQVRLSEFDIPEELNRTAYIVSDRLNRLLENASNRSLALTERLIASNRELKSSSLVPGRIAALLSEIRQCRLDHLDELNRIESSIKDMSTWTKRITVKKTRTEMAPLLDKWKRRFTDLRLASIRSGNLIQALTLRPSTISIEWVYLEHAVNHARRKLDRFGPLHMTLNEATITRVERNRILQNCIEVYEELSRDLIAWNDSSPDHFDQTFLPLLQNELKRLIQKAQRAIKKPASEPKSNATQAVFETEDGHLMIGIEKPAGQQSPRQFMVNDADGAVIEVWDNIAESNTFRLNTTQSRPAPPPPKLPTDVKAVVAEARARLEAVDALENKVRGYTTMEPINLEHMLGVAEATALETRASNVQSLDAGNPLVEQLRSRAAALKQSGEALRIQRSLESKTPTEGYLDYLIKKGRVLIRKKGTRQKLRDKRPDGQDDYLQEYEVYDATRQGKADKPIWYAHFHYVAPRSLFENFEKAHLKLFEQQYLGMKWQAAKVGAGATFADVKIWRGNIDKPLAKQHFEALN